MTVEWRPRMSLTEDRLSWHLCSQVATRQEIRCEPDHPSRSVVPVVATPG